MDLSQLEGTGRVITAIIVISIMLTPIVYYFVEKKRRTIKKHYDPYKFIDLFNDNMTNAYIVGISFFNTFILIVGLVFFIVKYW